MDPKTPRSRHKRTTEKPRKTWVRVLVWTVLFVLFTGGGAFAYVTYKTFQTANGTQSELRRGDKSDKRETTVDLTKDHFSVLLAGTDARPGDTSSRADTLIVATFNKQGKKVSMLSIPRDSLVYIPYVEREDKINHSFAHGGIDATIETVENLLDIPIDYYALVNFNGVVTIVDALGGIEVDVLLPINTLDSNDKRQSIQLEPGLQTLNGEEALAYARMRYEDPEGDIGRTKRQQQVIQAIVEKSTSLSSITKLNGLLDAAGENLQTNMSLSEAMQLQPFIKSLNQVARIELKGADTKINGGYYYQIDPTSLEQTKQELKAQLGLVADTGSTGAETETTDLPGESGDPAPAGE